MIILPLLQILFFLAAFFAPKDATQITLSGPDHAARWTLTTEGWVEDQKVWSIRGHSTVTRIGGGSEEVVDVSRSVKAAVANDWTKEKKVTLNPMQTLEKTEDGFIFRLNAGDPSERVYRITYGKKG